MGFFISNAVAAATTPAAQQPDGIYTLVMIVAIFVLFYFMLIRPQNKRAKEHKSLIGSLKKGDEIVTSGGFLAKVVSLDEQYIKINLADGVETIIQRGAVNAILPKGTIKSL